VQPRNPGDKPPAPGALAAVQAFVNTVDYEHIVEGLEGPDALAAFLRDYRLADAAVAVAPADVVRAREVREALRDLLMVRHEGALPAASVRVLDRTGRAAGLVLAAGRDGGLQLVPTADGVDAAFGRLLAIVHAAMRDGSWRRLKACPREVCKWAFWDASPAVSGIWCSMDVCGNRTKTVRYRRARGAA
jgi:predicted RNA-binding Zn ribbon-like protein